MQKVKAALLGLQHPHSRAHLSTLQQLLEVESIALWDPNAEALAELRNTQGAKVESGYTDLDALMADRDWSFAIVSVRNDLGPDIFLRVIESGRHLLAEKPVGRRAADAQRVIAAAKARGVKVGVAYMNRRNPAIEEARRLVGEGLLGPLMSMEVRIITTQVRFRNPAHWLFKQEYAGGGMLSWLGCHHIDLMRYLTHDEIVSVAAETATRSGENIDVEDVAALAVRFRSGAVGTLHTGYILALSGGGYHNPTGYDVYVGINGRLGRLYWSSSGRPIEFYVESVHPSWASGPQRRLHYTLASSPAYGGVVGEQFVREFILATQGEGEPPATGEDGLHVARIVDAAYESNRTGRRVEVETQ
jgi:predicted dehydrogenase